MQFRDERYAPGNDPAIPPTAQEGEVLQHDDERLYAGYVMDVGEDGGTELLIQADASVIVSLRLRESPSDAREAGCSYESRWVDLPPASTNKATVQYSVTCQGTSGNGA